jgi:glutamyl-tRNA reductase
MEQLFTIGVNHHQTQSSRRLQYHLDAEAIDRVYEASKMTLPQGCVILSTCNRIELYGCGDPTSAIQLLLAEKRLPISATHDFFVYQGQAALQYICRVAAGLESQVLGDLEILGQFKRAVRQAKSKDCLTGFLERLTNCAITSAKMVRNQTPISSGTASIAYAVVKMIQQAVGLPSNPRILLLGTGKFGQQILKNLSDYCPNARIALCNRTRERAQLLAIAQGNLPVFDLSDLPQALSQSDLVISAAAASSEFLVHQGHGAVLSNVKLLIDTSVPFSIQPNLPDLMPGLRLENLDALSRVVEGDMLIRRAGVPQANAIIQTQTQEFMRWAKIADQSDTIVHWNNVMADLGTKCPVLVAMSESDRRRFIRSRIVDFIDFLKQSPMLPTQKEAVVEHFIRQKNITLCCANHQFCGHTDAHHPCLAAAC